MTATFSIILASAVITPATAIEPRTWFTSKDHPKTALMVVERGPVAYQIDVSPDGSAIRCDTQGTNDLERKVCEIVMKKARFLPARDDQGKPMFGRHDGLASFLMPGKSARRPERAKLTVAVDRLPDGVTSPAYAQIAFQVDQAGMVSQCASTTAERRRSLQTVEALGPLACAHLVKEYRPVPVRDATGNAVPSIQSIMVRFEIRQRP